MTSLVGKFGSVILCDDIRAEVSNKYILIGVYGGIILYPNFPFQASLSLYLEYYPPITGHQKLHLRFGVFGKRFAQAQIDFETTETTMLPIALPHFQATFENECEFEIEASTDGVVWTTIRQTKIAKGSIQSGLPIPTIVGSPSGTS
jgi:hypothetical protein